MEVKFSQLANFHPKQLEAIKAMREHIYTLYGGAAGGGKSRLLRWAALLLAMDYAKRYKLTGGRVGLFCEDYPSLNDRHLSKVEYEFPAWIGKLNKSAHEFALNPEYGGWVIAFRNLDDPSKYLSSEFAAILVDEISRNIRETFDFLITRLRWPGIKDVRFLAGTNPGGPGHGFVKKLWIDKDFSDERFDPSTFAFVQARVEDNPHIDPSYRKQLDTLPENLRRAYMEGDWDMFKGQFFTEFRRGIHVIEPFSDPDDIKWFNSLPSFCGLDYGYNAPSAVVWGKIYDETWYIYRELYATGLTFEELRDKISSIERPQMIYADPSIWAKKDSPTSGAMKMAPLPLREAMNDRILGWNFFKQSLKQANLKIFSTCTNTIRTIPTMVYDETKTEDMNSDGDDHLCDALRYLIATHKTIKPQTKQLNYIYQKPVNKSDLREVFGTQKTNPLTIKYGK